jgi:DNA invertase Pin-like site-specific DNA recombinase
MTAFIAYYRVSTDRQGASGLGLEAQRAAVLRHINTGLLTTEYTEIESGKKRTNRPQLLTALQECRRKKATLVIAKLDGDSEACRSAFRTDVDHDSEVMPISIPN